MKIQILLIFFISSIHLFGQDSFKKEIDNIYNFHPHELSSEEQQKKFPALDSLFNRVKSDTTKYLPLLRAELQSNDHLPFFYFDCSNLLLINSESQSDMEICADAFSKCDIQDVDPQIYVSQLSLLAANNINVTKAAVKILEDSTFHFYIPEHAMDFMQGYCLMYCLLSLNPNLYVDTLVSLFQKTNNITTQKSIITTFWFAFSCSGDKFLESLNETNTLSKEVSDYAKRLLSENKIPKDAKTMFKNSSENDLMEIRKSALNRFSDEAIDDLDFTTKSLRIEFKCR